VPAIDVAVPPDPTLDLAKVVGVAIASGTADRDALFEVARRVIEGPDRFAQRLGFTVASAIIAAMHDLPPVPPRSAETAWDAPPDGTPKPADASQSRSPATNGTADVSAIA
jgi:hypothetical protein